MKCRKALQEPELSIHQLARIVVLSAARLAVPPAPLHYCALQVLKNTRASPPQESLLHINAKELLDAFLGLKTFVGNKKGIHVYLEIDSMSAVYYINKMGGMYSQQLMEIMTQVWNWSLEREINFIFQWSISRETKMW